MSGSFRYVRGGLHRNQLRALCSLNTLAAASRRWRCANLLRRSTGRRSRHSEQANWRLEISRPQLPGHWTN